MADEWFYARKGERFGPIAWAKLRSLADEGWLAADDLVWGPGLADWRPAASVRGVFRSSLAESLGAAVDSVIPGIRPGVPAAAAEQPAEEQHQRAPFGVAFLEELRPRHVVAACGAFVAALGIAFTVIAPSSLALAFTLGGFVLTAAGMHQEVGRFVSQAAANVARARAEAAERRLEAKRLAVEQQRLEVEAARLAAEKEARERPVSAPSASPTAAGAGPAAAVPPPVPRRVPADYYSPGEHVTVINHPPVQRWSPALAAVLSFVVPGLGQVYKGQVINGIVWFFLVGFGYLALILPGLVLHFFCIVGAASGNPWTPGRTEVVRV
ncbi:MAG: GYF domain-containing protein [Planctomycetaceae bacterium]